MSHFDLDLNTPDGEDDFQLQVPGGVHRRNYVVSLALEALVSGIPITVGNRTFIMEPTCPNYDGPAIALLGKLPDGSSVSVQTDLSLNQFLFMLAHISEREVWRLDQELKLSSLEDEDGIYTVVQPYNFRRKGGDHN